MRPRKLRPRLSIAVTTLLSLAVLTVRPAAQGHTGSNSSLKAQASKISWDKEAEVKRVDKRRKPRHPHKSIERVRLLTLQLRVLKRGNGNVAEETNPAATFHKGDQIRLAIKPNQDGYLYIINQTEGENGEIVYRPKLIFPDSRVNSGQNGVAKDMEYLVHAYCPGYANPRDCWFEMNELAGTEVVIVVFSRDMITDLEDRIGAGGITDQGYINQLKTGSGQKVSTSRPGLSAKQGGGAGRYVKWVTNTNTRDNEELIETMKLNHAAEKPGN